MPRAPSIEACNIALSEVRAASIVSIDDESPEAKACSIHYDNCLQLLLETHEWGFATVRSTLVQLATNDRSGEWLYAYAIPGNIASAAMIIDPGQSPLVGVFYPWPYLWPRPPFALTDFVISGETVYSNLAGAILQYVNRDVEEEAMPTMFKRALSLDLASRLAFALLNDRTLKGDLIQQAEAAKRRAIAEDLNRYPRRDLPIVDEVALVRGR